MEKEMPSKFRGRMRALRAYIVFRTSSAEDHVRFHGTGRLYVNPRDNRGKVILSSFGATQISITLMWGLMVKRFAPTLVLDVGANHGEVALSIPYKRETQIILFEPNPEIRPFLEMSIAAHRNHEQISLETALVSDVTGEQQFVVDHKWSGTSSAIGRILDPTNGFKGSGEEEFESIVVRSVRIDDILSEQELVDQTILFKIDVEGYEAKVIAGMKNSLKKAKCFAGIVEFDREYLRRAGTDCKSFFSSLQDLGGTMILMDESFTKINQLQDIHEHSDILIFSEGCSAASLSLPRIAKALYRGL
jgi:FkbM family methyltransferase